MATPPQTEAPAAMWYIGLHDTHHGGNSSHQDDKLAEASTHANDLGYNMNTFPITTARFRSHIQEIVDTHYHTEKYSLESTEPNPIVAALTPEDSILVPSANTSQLLAVSSSWIDLASADPLVADISRQVFGLEIAYASFCGISQVLTPGPLLPDGTISMSGLSQYARAIYEALSVSAYLHIHVVLPFSPVKSSGSTLFSSLAGSSDVHLSRSAAQRHPESVEKQGSFTAWEAWEFIRTFCKYSPRISVALVVPKSIPSFSIQARWVAEPVSTLIMPKSSFILNKHKQPVLQKPQQTLLTRFMRLRHTPWILLDESSNVSGNNSPNSSYSSASNLEPTPAEAAASNAGLFHSISSDPAPRLSYLRVLQRRDTFRPPMDVFGAGYQDVLQMPLQPLADNLESVTYEVFEKDPIKYEWYERAVAFALHDWIDAKHPGSCPDGRIVIAVAGSGRGPLVSRAIAAAKAVGIPVDVWAVEKNPNAYVLLQRYARERWNNQVTVVKSDMRSWKGPQHPDGTSYGVDILVSELLGSFGDNELSPECLDGVQHVLSKNGISIPSSYTAFLTPIASPRLHADLVSKARGSSDAKTIFNVPYVVMLHQYDFLSWNTRAQQPGQQNIQAQEDTTTTTEPALSLKTPTILPTWSFNHPIPPSILSQSALRRSGSAQGGGGGPTGGDGANVHNNRFCRLVFPCPKRGVCHGFAGYFETTLFKSEKSAEDRYGDGYTGDSDDEEWEEGDGLVELSTNPLTMDRMSKDMISWFPIYFPLRDPVTFPDHSELVISMWRQTDDRKVWYEWLVESFTTVGEGNVVRLGATELHSSKESGCLM
ncbi:Skb1 methyltransferase [Microthyrium microscopicum]|uniref:Protein arginine N-methyltransferase n=1 Tax=Microthyrium microscopicum TaxID=703497 RepID=A0A6A6U7P3_9PEZI|nr:Skb1 methyltransferase [Microthyrium microscopicum]